MARIALFGGATRRGRTKVTVVVRLPSISNSPSGVSQIHTPPLVSQPALSSTHILFHPHPQSPPEVIHDSYASALLDQKCSADPVKRNLCSQHRSTTWLPCFCRNVRTRLAPQPLSVLPPHGRHLSTHLLWASH